MLDDSPPVSHLTWLRAHRSALPLPANPHPGMAPGPTQGRKVCSSAHIRAVLHPAQQSFGALGWALIMRAATNGHQPLAALPQETHPAPASQSFTTEVSGSADDDAIHAC